MTLKGKIHYISFLNTTYSCILNAKIVEKKILGTSLKPSFPQVES